MEWYPHRQITFQSVQHSRSILPEPRRVVINGDFVNTKRMDEGGGKERLRSNIYCQQRHSLTQGCKQVPEVGTKEMGQRAVMTGLAVICVPRPRGQQIE